MIKLPQEIQTDLTLRVKQLRKSERLSQEQLANKSGVSLGSIKRFERSGKISLESLLKIAFVLNALDGFGGLFVARPATPSSIDELLNLKG